MVESDGMNSTLSDTKAELFTKELSYFLLTLVGFGAMLAMLFAAG